MVDLVDEHLDGLGLDPVGLDERVRDALDEPAAGVEVARGLLDGDDRHQAPPGQVRRNPELDDHAVRVAGGVPLDWRRYARARTEALELPAGHASGELF